MTAPLTLTADGPVATLTFNRPEKPLFMVTS